MYSTMSLIQFLGDNHPGGAIAFIPLPTTKRDRLLTPSNRAINRDQYQGQIVYNNRESDRQ